MWDNQWSSERRAGEEGELGRRKSWGGGRAGEEGGQGRRKSWGGGRAGEEGGQGRRKSWGGGRAGEDGGPQPMLWRLWDTLLSGQLGSLPVGQEDGCLVSLETSDGFGLACLAHHIHSLGRGREGERGRERERERGREE